MKAKVGDWCFLPEGLGFDKFDGQLACIVSTADKGVYWYKMLNGQKSQGTFGDHLDGCFFTTVGYFENVKFFKVRNTNLVKLI